MSNETEYPRLVELNTMCAEIRGLKKSNEGKKAQIAKLKHLRQHESEKALFTMDRVYGGHLHYHENLADRLRDIMLANQTDMMRQIEMELDAEIRANTIKINIKDAAIRAALRGEE